MKKSLIFKILYLFLILIVVAGASVFATNTYLASQVSYGNTNVENALNGLFKLKENTYNYSTDEKVVGKWIDGKPIYRKIINTGTINMKNDNIICDANYIDTLVSIGGVLKSGTTEITIPVVQNGFLAYFLKIDSNIVLRGYHSKDQIWSIKFISIEYTKTTD